MIKKLIRWFKLTFLDYYDPRHLSKDGVKYVIMPNGQRMRVESKATIKNRAKAKKRAELLDWAKKEVRR